MKCRQECNNIEGIIEGVTTEKDLGLTVDKALNFSEHISKVNKATRNL